MIATQQQQQQAWERLKKKLETPELLEVFKRLRDR